MVSGSAKGDFWMFWGKMNYLTNIKKIRFYLIILLVLFLDQLTKLLFGFKEVELIPKILYFKTLLNPGIIFGWFAYNKIIIYLIPLLIIIAMFIYYKKYKNVIITLGASLITAGLIGNIIDRVRLGYVIDFIFIPVLPEYNISSTNIADISLIVGVILLIYYNTKR